MLEKKTCPICEKEKMTTEKQENWICSTCRQTIITRNQIKKEYTKKKE